MATSSTTSFARQDSELRHGFQVAGLHLVPAARVLTEVVALADVFPVPKSSAAVVGVMNLRGNIVPLFDPQLVGQSVTNIHPTQRHVLVFDREEQSLGVLLDEDPELMSMVPAVGQHAKPASVLASYLLRPWACPDQPGQIWWEFDHRAAFVFLSQTTPLSAAALVDRQHSHPGPAIGAVHDPMGASAAL
jgi:twitching motility protein PilI